MNYKQYLQQRQYATKTIESNQQMLLGYLSWLDREGIEAENVENRDIMGYIQHCQKRGIERVTIQRYLNAVKLFYDFKIMAGTMQINPVQGIQIKGIKRNKLHRILSPEELHRLYNNYDPEYIPQPHGRHPIEHPLIEKRNRVMLGLFAYQGIQTKELYKLETGHIKVRAGQIEIPGTKRSNPRTLQLEPHQVLDVYDYMLEVRPQILQRSKQQTEILLVSPKGGGKISNYITAMLREVRRQGNTIENVQQLRASVIVKWLRMYNLRKVQYMAGHKYVSSTEKYRQNEMQGLQEEINQYHPLG